MRTQRSGRTVSGLPDAETRISADLDTITAEVRAAFGARASALLLIGGYARGEGSVVDRRGKLGPYNDYDLVLVTNRDDAESLRPPLAALAHDLSGRLGIEVELFPISRGALRTMPATLLWLDVRLGGVEVLFGSEAVLDDLPAITARDVPLAEAARLLANRATGIALSRLDAQDRDMRKARHGHKAILACGDSLLLAANRYAPTVAERARTLQRLRDAPAIGSLAARYAEAAEFRARPDEWSPEPGLSLDDWFASVVIVVRDTHLGFEARRVGTPETPAGYASARMSLFGDAPDISPLPVAALRAAFRRSTPLTPWVGHPRERLARVAVALAYAPTDASTRATALRLLGLPESASGDAIRRALLTLTEVGG